MSQEGKQIRKTAERFEAVEEVLEHEFGGGIGELSHRQRRALEHLNRLFLSLRGPEVLLDRVNYSRPFPPRPPRCEPAPQTERVFTQESGF